jgi:hypothetical protein
MKRKEAQAVATKHKMESSCEICGYSDFRALEFDHIDPSNKKRNVSQGCSISAVQQEMALCRVLCVICHHIHSRNQVDAGGRQALENTKWSNEEKIRRGCSLCGYTNKDYPCSLEWDHLEEHRDTKVDCISHLYRVSREVFMQEIAKCRVLCANCHRIHTNAQLNWKPEAAVAMG